MLWPDPLPLAGLKSKKRAIFELHDAKLHDEGCTVAKISLTLSSRVIAVGKAGQAAADVLLGSQELLLADAQYRIDKLVVVHLGSDIVDEDALAAALEVLPHIVVLSQPLSTHEPWARLFTELVAGDTLLKFKGGILFCVDHEEAIPSYLCQTAWVARGGRIRVEEVCVGLRVIDDVCKHFKTLSHVEPLIAQITDLVQENFNDFSKVGSTDLEAMAEHEESIVAALVVEDLAGALQLVGYLTYRYAPEFQAFYLARIAVRKEMRGRGNASYMVRWLMAKSKQLGCGAVSMQARPALQSVALQLGFSHYPTSTEVQNAMEEGSSWMEFIDRPMDPGLECTDFGEGLESELAPQSRKISKAARRKEFKKRR